MLLEEPSRYIHRTVRVSAPQSMLPSSEPKKEKRKKKLSSILPELESLDVIAESSEHSESSSTHTPMNENIIQSPARKKSPKRSPNHKVKGAKLPATISEVDEGDALKRRSRNLNSPPSLHMGHANTIPEQCENDSTGETDKLTESDNEGGDEESDYEDGEGSEESLDVVPQPASLINFLQKPGTKQQVTELPSFDADSSVMMFDYDGEDNDEGGDFSSSKNSVASLSYNGEEDDELTWRLDPSQSLSDWTITVVNKGTGTAEHYHVHKNLLAVGKRKSEYFAGIFREQRKARSHSNVTKLILPDTAARMIPMLLDYIYSNESVLDLSSETATGLRYLAQFFGIRVLFERIMRFIQKDLSLKTLASYYKGSADLGDKKVLAIAARHCARNIHLIDQTHNLMEVMDPPFFCKVLSSPGSEGVEKVMHLSLLVAKYCELHKDRLDEPIFLKLTCEENLPQVHHRAALSLLSMEADLVVATSVMSLMSITSLQERCIKSLASHWRELTELDPERTTQVCRKLPSRVVTELLIKSLESAKKDGNRQGSARVLVKGSQKGAKPKDEATMKREYEDAVAKIKAEFDEKMSHLQELCYEKDKHIKGYFEELGRYQRLPNTLEGKLVTSGRSVKPTLMPDVGKHSADGYLIVGKKKGSPKYPVFYYKGEEGG
jgi:BTB/POZ domain